MSPTPTSDQAMPSAKTPGPTSACDRVMQSEKGPVPFGGPVLGEGAVMLLIIAGASPREKNTAERAFWRATSAPKTGASGVRACASTFPSKSTIETLTWMKLLLGLRICARPI